MQLITERLNIKLALYQQQSKVETVEIYTETQNVDVSLKMYA